MSIENIKEKDYWLRNLDGQMTNTSLPYDYKNSTRDRHIKEKIKFSIPDELVNKVNKITNSSEYTMQVLFTTVLFVFINKYTESKDMVIGTPIYSQYINEDVKNNVLLIRNQFESEDSFKKLLLNIRETIKRANENGSYQLETLLYHLSEGKGIQHEIFDIAIAFDKIQQIDVLESMKNNLNFIFNKNEDGIDGFVQYNEKLYSKETINRFISNYIGLMENLLNNIDSEVKNASMLSERDKRKILHEFNGKKMKFDEDEIIYEIITKNAMQYPKKVAIESGAESITYEELEKKSNRIANYLRGKIKTGIDNRIGIIMDRGIDLIVVILGIWKAGAAYVPIDTVCPYERKRNIIKNGEIEIVFSQKEYLRELNLLQEECKNLKTYLCIDSWCIHNEKEGYIKHRYQDDLSTLEKYSDKTIENKSKQNLKSLAYIIYTSGSTGTPKGAMVEHLGMMNHMYAKIADLELNEDSIVAQNSSYTFDISVWQMFSALICGGKTIVYPNEDILNPEVLLNKIIEDKVSILEVVPSYLKVILDILQFKNLKFSNLEYVLVTGEEVGINLVNKWFEINKGIKLVNAYGPTEASDDITHFIIEGKCEFERVPIGRPIYNLNIYIVDKEMNLCPIGVKGEICVSGIGVGRGYFNDEEKTNKVFMKDIFKDDYRLYKTGDLGCWREDGTIDFFGRIDHQVKVRGFRIELGEIEKNLIKYDGIKDAIVIDKIEDNGSKFLSAYLITTRDIKIDKIKEYLMEKLPYYMVPQQFVIVDEMPLTPNGKVDRKALASIQGETIVSAKKELPANELEEKLLSIFKQILAIEDMGVCDNFFELGGDSIKAIQVVSRLQKDNLKLDINDIFTKPTIRQLTSNIENMIIQVEQGIVTGEVIMTPIQKWFFESKKTNIDHYNQSMALYSKNGINKDAIEIVCKKLVEQHDVFRMIFKMENGQVIQKNRGLEDDIFKFNVFEVEESEDIERAISVECDKLQRSINLSEGKLMSVALFKTQKGDYLIMISHHVIIDGISWRIVLDDLSEGYRQYINGQEIELQQKTHSYQEWANKLKEYAQSEQALSELEYWSRIEKVEVDKVAKDKSAIDKDRVSKNFKKVTMKLNRVLTKQLLKDVNQTYNTEINDVLISALGIALKRWGDVDNMLISMEGHGREDIIEGLLINRTVGWFTSQFPLLLNTEEYEDIGKYLKKTKDMIRKIPNKGVGYGILKYLTDKDRKDNVKLDIEPEINFNYLGQFKEESDEELFKIVGIEIGDLENSVSVGRSENEEIERNEAINIEGAVVNDKLVISFGYNACKFNESRIEELVEVYKLTIIGIIQHCINKEAEEVTLSDLTYNNLTNNELQEIEDYLSDIDL